MEHLYYIIKIIEQIESYPIFINFFIMAIILCFFMIKILDIYPKLFSFFNKNRKIELYYTELLDFDNECNDIYSFNRKYKVNAITKIQIKNYISWLKDKGISPNQIKLIKNYFNVQTLRITRVKNNYINYLIIIFCFISYCICYSLLFVVNSNSVFLLTDEKEPIVWLSKQDASIYSPSWLPVFHTDWKLASKECRNLDINSQKYKLLSSKLSSISIQNICDTFNNAAFDNDFNELLSKFHKLLFLYLIISIFFGIYLFRLAYKRIFTRQLREKIIINKGKKVLLFKLKHRPKKS